MPGTIVVKRKHIAWGVLVLALLAILALLPSLRRSTIPGTPEVAGERIAAVILTLDYRQREAWKDALWPLCTQEGQEFWQRQIDGGLWNAVEESRRITDEVIVEGAEAVEMTLEDGSLAALVIVQGRVLTHDEAGGEFDEGFYQRLVLTKSLGGRWLLQALIDPQLFEGG
jgi:hypothetical protein